jgi:hypothetical protein
MLSHLDELTTHRVVRIIGQRPCEPCINGLHERIIVLRLKIQVHLPPISLSPILHDEDFDRWARALGGGACEDEREGR